MSLKKLLDKFETKPKFGNSLSREVYTGSSKPVPSRVFNKKKKKRKLSDYDFA